MSEYRGVNYLRNKLSSKKNRVDLRYHYYEMKDPFQRMTFDTNIEMLELCRSVSGWCTKAVDSLADRLVFRKFEDDNFDLNSIYSMNNPDTIFDSTILSALIASCCFIYISEDENGYPRLQVIDGANATGIMDPITGLLKEGYAILKEDDYGNPALEAYFTSEYTEYITKGKKNTEKRPHKAGYPLLVPIVYRPDAKRPFGHSRISRSCMYLQKYAKRTLTRSEISAEFYSFPQKYVTGLSQDAERMDKWKASMSSLMQFTKDEDGDSPKLGQFTQQSMSPYIDQVRMAAAIFAGETGLTMDDLGFVTDNPSSAEAIKASHENLRLTAKKAQRTFGSGFLNVGYLAACIRDDYPYQRSQLYLTKPLWEPVFEPDAATLSSIGDGAIKINQAVPGYFGSESLRALTGIKSDIQE